jgi:FMN-dependent NADH-azoreductase
MFLRSPAVEPNTSRAEAIAGSSEQLIELVTGDRLVVVSPMTREAFLVEVKQ